MAITGVDALVAALKQPLGITKTQTATSVAAQWHTLVDRAGSPGAGTLAVGNTANGLVPTDLTAGFPVITSFGGGAGVLHSLGFSNTVACRMKLYDRLFHSGAHALTPTGTTTLASQPDATGRMPDGLGHGNEIWLEMVVTAAASAVTVQVGYTNSDGTTGRLTTASASLSGFITGRLVNLPLQAGDKGVRQITSVIIGGTAAATGSVNVIMARPLVTGMRVPVVGGGDILGFDKTGLVRIYEDSALWPIIAPDSTNTGLPDLLINVSSG